MVIVLGPRSVALSNLFRTWPPKVIAGLAIFAWTLVASLSSRLFNSR